MHGLDHITSQLLDSGRDLFNFLTPLRENLVSIFTNCSNGQLPYLQKLLKQMDRIQIKLHHDLILTGLLQLHFILLF